MSYDLLNPSTTICRKFSRQFLVKALELAEDYGWQPLGTQPPPWHNFHDLNAEWDGNYLTNDGQIINAQDALSLSNALEQALSDIPDSIGRVDWNLNFWMEDDLPEWLSPEEQELVEDGIENELFAVLKIHPLEFFAGDEKHYLKKFIKFCGMGDMVVF